MMKADDILKDLYKYTPSNWAVKDGRGRTLVVIEATSAAIATARVAMLGDELPRLPQQFTVVQHSGPRRGAWYNDSWFRIREQVDNTGIDAEPW